MTTMDIWVRKPENNELVFTLHNSGFGGPATFCFFWLRDNIKAQAVTGTYDMSSVHCPLISGSSLRQMLVGLAKGGALHDDAAALVDDEMYEVGGVEF